MSTDSMREIKLCGDLGKHPCTFRFNQTAQDEYLDLQSPFPAPVPFGLSQMHWVRVCHNSRSIVRVHDRSHDAIHQKQEAEVLRMEEWIQTGNVE